MRSPTLRTASDEAKRLVHHTVGSARGWQSIPICTKFQTGIINGNVIGAVTLISGHHWQKKTNRFETFEHDTVRRPSPTRLRAPRSWLNVSRRRCPQRALNWIKSTSSTLSHAINKAARITSTRVHQMNIQQLRLQQTPAHKVSAPARENLFWPEHVAVSTTSIHASSKWQGIDNRTTRPREIYSLRVSSLIKIRSMFDTRVRIYQWRSLIELETSCDRTPQKAPCETMTRRVVTLRRQNRGAKQKREIQLQIAAVSTKRNHTTRGTLNLQSSHIGTTVSAFAPPMQRNAADLRRTAVPTFRGCARIDYRSRNEANFTRQKSTALLVANARKPRDKRLQRQKMNLWLALNGNELSRCICAFLDPLNRVLRRPRYGQSRAMLDGIGRVRIGSLIGR